MGQKPDRQSSSQQEQNKKKKMGELTSLATQAKMFHLSIKHYCVCPDVSGHIGLCLCSTTAGVEGVSY